MKKLEKIVVPTKAKELESVVDSLCDALDGIADLADEALDPELTREELICIVKAIAHIALSGHSK